MDQYEIIDKLGEGSKGIVYLAKNLSNKKIPNELVAIKVITKKGKYSQDIQLENIRDYVIPNLLGCHDNIACTYDIFDDVDNIYIINEYYENSKTLKDWPIPDQKTIVGQLIVLDMFSILAEAINIFHSNGIIHADIKRENILYQTFMTPKGIQYFPILIDFDLSCTISTAPETIKNKFICRGTPGTPLYMPIELLLRRPIRNWTQVDIYCLGVLFYQLYNDGEHPYDRNEDIEDIKELIRRIETDEIRPSQGPDKDINELIMYMINKDKTYRPPINRVRQIIDTKRAELQKML